MKTTILFELCEISLPENIEVEVEGEGESKQYFLGDKNEQGGILSVKRMQWTVPDAEKREKMLTSVYAETESEELAQDIRWGLEELSGVEDGEKVAITRWLVTCLQHAPKFDLLIFNYTATVTEDGGNQINDEIMLYEEAIQNAVWH